MPVMELIRKLQLRFLNATQVLQAYMAQAIIVQDRLNCITEFVPFALVCVQTLSIFVQTFSLFPRSLRIREHL